LPRAIYRTGHRSQLDESLFDPSRYRTHAGLLALDGEAILQARRNYITIWDYWNGLDPVDDQGNIPVTRSLNAVQAVELGLLDPQEALEIVAELKKRLSAEGVDVLRLVPAHILLSINAEQVLARDETNKPKSCLCNFQYLRLPACPEGGDTRLVGESRREPAGGALAALRFR
jgi:hypothetical protein